MCPLEEQAALNDAVINYCTQVDSLTNLDAIVDCFTDDAVLDLTGLALPRFEGATEIRLFYAKVFKDMSHHCHMMTNFRVVEFAPAEARCRAYVAGMGRSKGGIDVQVYVYYDLDFRKIDGRWKIARFYEAPMLPMPASVTAVHG